MLIASTETGEVKRMELLDVNEAAQMFRLKESTVRSWILKRKIAHVKLGRRVFLRLCDCQQLIDASLVLPKAQEVM